MKSPTAMIWKNNFNTSPSKLNWESSPAFSPAENMLDSDTNEDVNAFKME